MIQRDLGDGTYANYDEPVPPPYSEDDWPQCSQGIHDFEAYDAEDGSVRNACRDCAEPADPEIITPAPFGGIVQTQRPPEARTRGYES